MIRIVIMLIGSTFVSICMFKNCQKVEIPASDKAWFSHFNIGEEYIYLSDKGVYDTIRVVDKCDDYTPCNKLEIGEYQFNRSKVALERNNTQYIYALFTSTESNSIWRNFKFDELSGQFYGNEIQNCVDTVKIESISKFIPVYTISNKNTAVNSASQIVSFSWNKMLGIVRYETRDGEVFKLVK